ncbi:hypothetical protein C8J56DRAFT_1042573 [Mycena floridula]|nr:hypothetical protein C8J56DRAFT_1042573 [Mycena floridula]
MSGSADSIALAVRPARKIRKKGTVEQARSASGSEYGSISETDDEPVLMRQKPRPPPCDEEDSSSYSVSEHSETDILEEPTNLRRTLLSTPIVAANKDLRATFLVFLNIASKPMNYLWYQKRFPFNESSTVQTLTRKSLMSTTAFPEPNTCCAVSEEEGWRYKLAL